MTPRTGILPRPDGATIAYDKIDGEGPGLVFLHGLNSDRKGTKAGALADHCSAIGRSFLALDMFGHGDSSGDFAEGGISRWTEDTVAVLEELTHGPQVLVGSSMGGWVMLRAAAVRPISIAGLIGIAAAPDFTEDLIWETLSQSQQEQVMSAGVLEQPSDYAEEPYVISQHLIEDGRRCLVLRNPIDITVPVRLVHGQQDADVPWQTALRLSEALISADVEVILIKDGDHRLSRPYDLQRLCGVVDHLINRVENTP